MVVPLSVGQTDSGRGRADGGIPQEWEQALAEGMTHAHLRFEARSDPVRQAEVQDLVVALRPLLNAFPRSDSDLIRLSPDRPVEVGMPPEPRPVVVPAVDADAVSDLPGDAASDTGGVLDPGAPASRRPWFAAAREWGLWSRARAATPFLAGLFGRARRSLAARKGEGTMAWLGTATPANLEHDGATGGDVVMAPALRGHDAHVRQATAEPPASEEPAVSEPPVSEPPPSEEPPVSEPPASEEPPVSEPPASEEPSETRADRSAFTVAAARAALALDPAVPVALFADELSTDAGADILVEAAMIVGHDERPMNFLFVGDGPLKGELEARMGQAGLADRSRFPGDASAESFEPFFAAADFVIIPARVPRNEVLARRAAAAGKPLLITHQACVNAVAHGSNGLVTYDNPGSFVWGLRELVHCMQPASSADGRVRESVAA
jgi:glycosyltransferase involved in cell wall biosynthesis